MSVIAIPDWVNISMRNDGALYFPVCVAHADDSVEYDGETITKGEYLKKYLFSNKYNNKITIEDSGVIGSNSRYHLYTLYLDKNNNSRMSFVCCTGPSGTYLTSDYTGISACFDILAYKPNYGSSWELPYTFIPMQDMTSTTMKVKSFDSFCVVLLEGPNTRYNTATQKLIIVYDFTNYEMMLFDSQLWNIHFSKPGSMSYSKALTYDGNNGYAYRQILRGVSNSDVTYTKFTRTDNAKATRIYMLSRFPAAAQDHIIHVGNKYLYVLPYDEAKDSYSQLEKFCAMAIDVTADIV